MPGSIPDEGSPAARLVLVGEAPGQHEERLRRPFVGPSGYKLEEWWGRFGLARGDFYITNVWPEKPAGNRIESVPVRELEGAVDDLHARLAQLSDPWLIVPTGNTALRALMRRPLRGKESPKITDWRGSLLGYRDNRGRTVKVIPTLHPAFVLREPGAERACLHDWKRVAKDRTFRDLRLPARDHAIEPTFDDLIEFRDSVLHDQEAPLAFDIETTQQRGNQILCVGFALSKIHSFTVPTTDAYWLGKAELSDVWEVLTEILHARNPKITQNGSYDYYWLGQLEEIRPVRWHWDTLAMHHCLDCTDAHDLGYLASFDTRQPFWKRTTKDVEQRASYANDEHALWTYNGIDCCVTYELWAKYLKRLEQRGMLEFYIQHYRELQRPALKMARHGIRVDDRRRRWWHFNLQAERIEIQDRLAVLAGAPLHAAKSLSTTKLKAFLYNKETGLGLPAQRDRKTKSETTGEVAIRKLMQWTHTVGAKSYKRLHLEQVREILNLILEERRKDKLVGFLAPAKIDPDGKLRASFKLTTETGRFASSSNPMRTGLNLQNQDREIRHTFIPDRDDQIYLECDLSQVEGRIVYVRSKDPKLIALAQTHPSDFDMHTYNAKLIFGVEQPTKEQRYLGKKVTHGAQRGLGGDKLSGELLKDGYVKSPLECGRYIQQYLTEHPGLQRYFAAVRQTLLRDRQLVNLFGRVWNVQYERFNDELYRRGYSWWPQSENGDLMNQWGFKPCSKWLAKEKLDAAINVQMHDSLLISCKPENVYDIAAFLKENLERPLDYGYCKLSIPVEFKLGRTWKGDREFKTLPARDEFTEAALDLLQQSMKEGDGQNA